MINIIKAIFVVLGLNIDYLSKIYNLSYFKSFIVCLPILLMIFFIPSLGEGKLKSKRLNICRNGYNYLDIFVISSISILLVDILKFLVFDIEINHIWFVIHIISTLLIELLLFLSGIIRVYICSKQLGLAIKIIGIFTWYIPIINIIVLYKIIRKVKNEVKYENNKIVLNEKRESEEICKTKYPLFLVHGVFFRDYKYFNYWGRIPEELEQNGGVIYYGNHQSASSVEDSSKELFNRIKNIIEETGCEKVNVIAHSKGGIDSKYLLTYPEIEKYVASITTINTPHEGCTFVDYLFSKIPDKLLNKIAEKYNKTLKLMGDTNPDFIVAVNELTTKSCQELNNKITLNSNIFCQSIGSKLNKPIRGRFPLNYSSIFVKHFDGVNDGLVGEKSFKWGEKYLLIESTDKRGISHGDIIDLNRENLKGFDVREFYVQLVHDLKMRNF